MRAYFCSLALSLSLFTSTTLPNGASIVMTHNCICGARVDPDGLHGLSCRRSAGGHSRHAAINIVAFTLCKANIPACLEPTHLVRDDGMGPDGTTLVPWACGKCLFWGFTCPYTLAPSHIHKSSVVGTPKLAYRKKTVQGSLT